LNVLAHINDDLGCTLYVDDNLSWLSWVVNSTSRSLLDGVEWTGILDSSELLLDKKVDWDISILQESKESDLSGVTYWNVSGSIHFNSSRAVEQDTLFNEIQSLITKLTVKKGILSGVFDLLIFTKELRHFHVSTSDSAGLANK
jgi:hypothetical protein